MEVPVPNQESGPVNICMLGISIFPASIFFGSILDLFQRHGIFVLFVILLDPL